MTAAAVPQATRGLPADALLALGIETANFPQPDLVSAHKWFNLAALGGSQEASLHRQEVALLMSPGEVAAAQRAAREWLRVH